MMEYWKQFKKDTFVPSGFMAIPDAFELVGRTIYEDEHWGEKLWTGREAGYELPLSKEERERRDAVLRWMHLRASGGLMLFYFFYEGRSALIGRDLWNVPEPVAFKRFDLCTIDMAPYLPGPSPWPCPAVIMAEKHSLLHDLAGLQVGPCYPEGTNTQVEGALENIRALRSKRASPQASEQPAERAPQSPYRPKLPLDLQGSPAARGDLETVYEMARRVRDGEAGTLHDAAGQLAEKRRAELKGKAPTFDSMVTRLDRLAKRLFDSKTGLPRAETSH